MLWSLQLACPESWGELSAPSVSSAEAPSSLGTAGSTYDPGCSLRRDVTSGPGIEKVALKRLSSTLSHAKCAAIRLAKESVCSRCWKEKAGTETARLTVFCMLRAACVCIEAGNEADGVTGANG